MYKMRIRLNHLRLVVVLAALMGVGLFLVSYWTVQEEVFHEPVLLVQVGEKPEVTAKSYLVLDMKSGKEVVSLNSDEQLPIASVTKLFAAAAFKARNELVGTTTVTWGDVATEGRAGKLMAGDVYPYHELLEAMIVESSNDAATTIGRTDVGVLEEMNNYPLAEGFSSTTFSDTSGLSDRNLSTAYELATLTRKLWQEDRYIFDVSNMPQIIGTHTGWVNNNPFISMEGYKGGKHGFTYEANRTAVAVFSDPVAGKQNDFLYVVLGSDNLTSDIEQLRTYVSNNVSWR